MADEIEGGCYLSTDGVTYHNALGEPIDAPKAKAEPRTSEGAIDSGKRVSGSTPAVAKAKAEADAPLTVETVEVVPAEGKAK